MRGCDEAVRGAVVLGLAYIISGCLRSCCLIAIVKFKLGVYVSSIFDIHGQTFTVMSNLGRQSTSLIIDSLVDANSSVSSI
jgi:hypothetical protein